MRPVNSGEEVSDMNPSGAQYVIEAAGYSAVVTEVGATLRDLRYDDRPLIAGFATDELRPVYRGAVLAPWPNRIADGRYVFAGTQHQLALSEPARSNALHGLVAWSGWRLWEHAADRVVLVHRIHPQDGYPFHVDLRMTYALGSAGLSCELSARNSGEVEAPYGCASHCYLVGGAGRVDDWTLELDAGQYLEVTSDRLLPIGLRDVAGTTFDLREGPLLGDVFIDHAFTNLGRNTAGWSRARLLAADGHGVSISWDATQPWVQVHTADRPEPHLHRCGLAIEPMTCPPDAFNSGTDVITLSPGGYHEARWVIAAV